MAIYFYYAELQPKDHAGVIIKCTSGTLTTNECGDALFGKLHEHLRGSLSATESHVVVIKSLTLLGE